MTKEKIIMVLDLYEDRVLDYTDYMKGSLAYSNKILHILDMIPKMREFLKEERLEKIFRWLGFIQGVLWTEEMYTLDELKDHNRDKNNIENI